MRVANFTAAVAIVIWLGLAMLGRASLSGFLLDGVANWPTLTVIDYNIVVPMAVASALLAWAWFCNAVGRWPMALGLASVACLAGVLPYLMMFGGGI